jgi:hypothetical protein
MGLERTTLVITIGLLAACGRPQPHQGAQQRANSDQASEAPRRQPPPTVVSPTVRQGPVLDPKSSEAAESIAQAFVDLLNRRRFDQAYMLVGPGAPPRADFDRDFAAFSDLRATTGTPGQQEGAAGSIYLTIPVQLSGRVDGKDEDRSIMLVMRRVNDVPGSTDAQRRWHIERIDTGAQPG